MNNTTMIELTAEEMMTIGGGEDNLRCFVSGAAFVIGIATLQPEIILVAAMGAVIHC